jgi:3-keto-5-aminohexanoate cleavage enzyme
MDKIIINFTPTGIIPKKTDTPHVPISPEEIIRDVETACALGISMVHLHARNSDDQSSSNRKEIYGEIIAGIRSFAPELIICVSTSGRIINNFESRSDVLSLEDNLKPDMASLTLSSLNFNKSASINEPSTILALAGRMKEKGIKPELEIFDLGMVNYFNYLIKKGLLSPPYYANLILGNIACAQGDLLHIGCMIKDFHEGTFFSLGAVGNAQLKINSLAIAMGWGVRTGLEDNYWHDETRSKLTTNLELLKRIHEIIAANEKVFMSPQELRQKLHLEAGFGRYGAA